MASAGPVDADERHARQERLAGPPVAPTPTIGRKREIETVCGLLESRGAQLVTLTGAGGVGKTRVALAVAHAIQTTIPNGVGWVELAGAARAEDVAPVVAQALGIAPSPSESVSAALRRHLAGKRSLLVIDNFEHVLDAAVLVADLLAASPGLSVLATSREALDLTAEHRVLIAPLALPQVSEDVTVAELESTDATALFLAAARRRDECFQATPETAPTISRICAQLEGLPLALELAAARAGALGVRALSARVDEAVSELGSGPRDAPARQRTLRATIDWSYRLLDVEQSGALVRFAVFAGGATLDAAQAVTGATPAALEALAAKNLIDRRGQPDGSSRLLMLETIREYARERLDNDPEHDTVSRRHAGWFLRLAKQADEHLQTEAQTVWFPRLHAETDNLRAVLAWSLQQDIALGVELASTLVASWRLRGQSHELIPWLERALASPTRTDMRTRAVGLLTFARALLHANKYARAREPLEESLPLFRSLADRSGEAGVLLDLGTVAWSEGSFHTAMALSEEALAIYRDAGNKHEIAHTLHRLGNILRDSGDFERGMATLEEALAIVDELGDRFRFALIAHSLGDLALDQSDHERATPRYHEALSAAVEVGDESLPHYCLAGQACIAALQGDTRNAGRLWAAAEAIEDRLRARMVAPVRKRYERILTPLSEDQRFQEGQEAGRDMPLGQVVRELMSAAPRGDRQPSEGDPVSSA